MSIIAIVAAFLIPSLGTSSGRALDAATRQFVGDLENARLTAIAERTHTRVIVPISEIPILGTNLTLRSYVIASLDKTSGKWTQRSKLNRLTTSVAFDPTQGILQPSASPAPSPTILISDKSFTAPYVEFRSDGSTSLDPNVPSQVIGIGDALVDSAGVYHQKNQKLKATITVDPLSGAVTTQ